MADDGFAEMEIEDLDIVYGDKPFVPSRTVSTLGTAAAARPVAPLARPRPVTPKKRRYEIKGNIPGVSTPPKFVVTQEGRPGGPLVLQEFTLGALVSITDTESKFKPYDVIEGERQVTVTVTVNKKC